MPEQTTVTFSYTKDGTTVTDTHDITVDKIPSGLHINGASSTDEGVDPSAFTATVTYTDFTTSVVSIADWASSNTAAATINASTGAVVVANDVTGDQTTTISCSYTEGGTTVNASQVLTVNDLAPVPTSVVITGPSTVDEGGNSINLVATVTYDDLSTAVVTTSANGAWSSVTPATASVGTTSGIVTSAADVASDTDVDINYTYTENGATVNATAYTVTVTDVATGTRTVKFGYGKYSNNSACDASGYTGQQNFFDTVFVNDAATVVDGMVISIPGTPALNGNALDDYPYIAIPASYGAPGSGDFYQVWDNAAGGMDGAEADQPPPGAVPYVTFFPSAPPKFDISVDDGLGVSTYHVYRTDFPVDPASKGKTTWDIQITNLPNI